MNRFRVLVAALSFGALFLPSIAEAAEGTPPASDASSGRAIELAVTPLVGVGNWGGTSSGKPGGQVALMGALAYRIDDAFSLGVIGSLGAPLSIECSVTSGGPSDWYCGEMTLMKGAAEGRWHPLVTRHADTWLAADVGVAIERSGAPETRFAPLVGAGGGVAYVPVRFFSIGVEGRAHVMPFDRATRSVYAPQGPTIDLFAGLVLALHVPLGG